MGVLKKASRAWLELAFFCCDLLPLPTMLTAYCFKTLNGEASGSEPLWGVALRNARASFAPSEHRLSARYQRHSARGNKRLHIT